MKSSLYKIPREGIRAGAGCTEKELRKALETTNNSSTKSETNGSIEKE